MLHDAVSSEQPIINNGYKPAPSFQGGSGSVIPTTVSAGSPSPSFSVGNPEVSLIATSTPQPTSSGGSSGSSVTITPRPTITLRPTPSPSNFEFPSFPSNTPTSTPRVTLTPTKKPTLLPEVVSGEPQRIVAQKFNPSLVFGALFAVAVLVGIGFYFNKNQEQN